MSKILSGEELCHVLEGLGYSEPVVEAADAIEDSHEALRERVTELERLIRAHGDAQATLRNELNFAGVSLDLSEHYERADAQLIAEAEAWHE